MRHRPPHPHQDERGFILVGVVTFMLALTILGLSLFALSSYEAQFFGASATREQALQNCESGMSLVQALLESRFPRSLESARLAVGQFGITSAIAYQQRSPDSRDTVSSGLVDWDSTIVIVVKARSGGAERTLEARYLPVTNANPYQRLITAGGAITYREDNSRDPSTFRMAGRVWQYVQSDADTAWTRDVTWTSGRPVDPSVPPVPLADAFVDEKMSGTLWSPTNVNYVDPDVQEPWRRRYSMTFSSPTGTVRFFRSPELDPDDHYSPNAPEFPSYAFYCEPAITLTIKGTVVWVVPDGLCLGHALTVKTHEDADTPPTLIIVAKANRRDPGRVNRGIWLQGGLDLTATDGIAPRVYLVSQGDVAVTHDHSRTTDHDADAVSIVAGGSVELEGPLEEARFRLGYGGASMDALGDQLLGIGALPPVSGGGAAAFASIRGQWRETTPR